MHHNGPGSACPSRAIPNCAGVSRSHRPRSTAPPPVTASHKSHNAPYRPAFGDSDRVSAAADEVHTTGLTRKGQIREGRTETGNASLRLLEGASKSTVR